MAAKKRPGLWVRVHDRIWQDDRVLDLAAHGNRGIAAVGVFVMSVAWSHHDRRDGELPRGVLPLIHAKPEHARILVEVGLWEPTQNGWRIPKYADWQDTRDEIESNREKKRRGGQASHCARNHPQPCTDAECPSGAGNVVEMGRKGRTNA